MDIGGRCDVLDCFTTDKDGAVPITALTKDGLSDWLDSQTDRLRAWVKASGFKAGAAKTLVLPGEGGAPSGALLGIKGADDFWSWGAAAATLPEGRYSIAGDAHKHAPLGWALGCYQFTRYKDTKRTPPVLAVNDKSALPAINNIAEAIYLARDLINTPSSDMGPGELAAAATELARRFDAECKITVGDDLLRDDYPMIHAVGRASDRAPRLIDLTWGKPNDPKITLVGKGVCFDTGGLDLKAASGMLMMKKDMGGAAQALALGHMIMANRLNVRLRVLVPAVENSVSGNAFRPGDILKTRKGISVEIGNTDAEGRLVLGDALTDAVSEKPEMIFDFATLTGAARVALGPDLSVMFSNDDALAGAVEQAAAEADDPVWRMPLWEPYRRYLDSDIADINNAGQSRFAGAVTAALFLKEFAGDDVPWAHFDLYAWNRSQRPGRPVGGDAMAIRAVYTMLAGKYGG